MNIYIYEIYLNAKRRDVTKCNIYKYVKRQSDLSYPFHHARECVRECRVQNTQTTPYETFFCHIVTV